MSEEQMTPEQQALEDVWAAIMTLTEQLGAVPLNKHLGCWYHRVDDRWEIAINGQKETMACNSFSHHRTPIDVKPFTIYVEYNGFPAGVIDPYGCSMAAGSAANIHTFRDALQNAAAIPGTR